MRTTEVAVATKASCYLGLDVLAAGMGILAENAEDAIWLQDLREDVLADHSRHNLIQNYDKTMDPKLIKIERHWQNPPKSIIHPIPYNFPYYPRLEPIKRPLGCSQVGGATEAKQAFQAVADLGRTPGCTDGSFQKPFRPGWRTAQNRCNR